MIPVRSALHDTDSLYFLLVFVVLFLLYSTLSLWCCSVRATLKLHFFLPVLIWTILALSTLTLYPFGFIFYSY